MRSIGEICFWDKLKGFGFIEVTTPVPGDTSGLEERDTLYVHNSDVANRKQLHVGDLVTFTSVPSGNSKHPFRASDVRIIRFAEAAASQSAVEASR